MSPIKTFLGLALLVLGLAIIFYSLYSSFNIFTGKTEPPQVFKMQESSQAAQSDGLQEQFQQIIQDQLKGMLPLDSISTLLNMISWSILAGVLLFGGAQISGLGIKLLK